MTTSKISFDTKDTIKLVGFLGVIFAQWYDIKTTLKVNDYIHRDHEKRLDKIEIYIDNEKKLAVNSFRPFAILPRETKIENEN